MKSQHTIIATVALLALPGASTAFTYAHDDGTGENNVGLNAPGGDLLWLNEFVSQVGGEVIISVDIAFGVDTGTPGALDGRPVDIFIWSDPNNDGNPGDAQVVSQLTSVVIGSEDDIFTPYVMVPAIVNVGDNFFVGALFEDNSATDFVARIDQTGSQGRSWAAFAGTGTLDPNDIAGTSTFGVIDSFGIPGNWMVRATATPVPEPATFAVLGLGAVALLRRRRK